MLLHDDFEKDPPPAGVDPDPRRLQYVEYQRERPWYDDPRVLVVACALLLLVTLVAAPIVFRLVDGARHGRPPEPAASPSSP